MDGFSEWFRQASVGLLAAEAGDAADQIQKRLDLVDSRLGIEVADVDGGKELIISAMGVRDAFAVAETVADSVSGVEGWIVHALKPGLGFGFTLEIGGWELRADELLFDPLSSGQAPGRLGVRIYARDEVCAEAEIDEALRVIVQTGLGERLAAEIEHLEVAPISKASAGALMIQELPTYVQWHLKTIG